MTIQDFTEYFNSFYGKNGIYTMGDDLCVADVANAVIAMQDNGWKFEGDSIDRERVRDIIFG